MLGWLVPISVSIAGIASVFFVERADRRRRHYKRGRAVVSRDPETVLEHMSRVYLENKNSDLSTTIDFILETDKMTPAECFKTYASPRHIAQIEQILAGWSTGDAPSKQTGGRERCPRCAWLEDSSRSRASRAVSSNP